MKKHIPNMITVFRLLFVPLFIYLVLTDDFVWAAIVFFIAGLSDMLDGYLARRWKVVSNFGKLADPLADKAIQICAVLLLCILGRLHFAFIIVLIIKEGLLIWGSYLLFRKKVVVFAAWYGKAATLLLNGSIFWIFILNLPALWVNILIGISMAAELFALAMYTKRYFELRDKADTESGAIE